MGTRYRLCEQDREEFGGDEWYPLDVEGLAAMRARQLELIEKQLGVPIATVTNALRGDGTALGLRALVWLARYQAGLRTPFADFNIRTLKVDADVVEDEPDAEVADIAPLDSSATPGSATS